MTAELRLPPARSARVPLMYHQAAPPPPPPTPAKPPPSWRTIGLVVGGITAIVALIGIAAAVSPTDTAATTTTNAPATTVPAPTPTTTPTYKPFDEVDPLTSIYFITLESTGLAEAQGEERLYNLGLGVCRNLDGGNTIEQELAGLTTDARLSPGDAGALVGAAVTDLCPHHGPAVERYLKEHG